MKYPKIPLAQTIIELCKAKQIKHIVISPGSRNAPLTIGFINNTFFECYSIVDERCAAFFALGIAQQIRQPVALVCTSGSALLNYYPAIAEAFYSDIPLVVLSADRPKYLIGIGDGQTINQDNVYKNHVVYSVNLKGGLKENHVFEKQVQIFNDTEINNALNTAITQKGPVHINIPFEEPLYELVDGITVKPKLIDAVKIESNVEESILKPCISHWNSAVKKMILIGVNHPNSIEQKWLDILAKDESIVVFTETTSNIHHHNFFPSIDKIIAPLSNEEFAKLQPDILLTFGGMIVSKKVKAFLRTYKPNAHWHVDTKKANDTFFSLSEHIKAEPNHFLKSLLSVISNTKSDYKSYWNAIKIKRHQKHENYINQIPFSDLMVFDTILKSVPESAILQSGNSSAIRYMQLFNIKKSVHIFCNRGTSGIDGSTSTAIGCAVVNTRQTICITGDLSFFYDSNALWNNYIPNNFRIIVINNQGGGIFRILPNTKNTKNFDTYFENKHQKTAKHLCEMYGSEYITSKNESELSSALHSFYTKGHQPKLLEIFTPRTTNDEILLKYFEYLDHV